MPHTYAEVIGFIFRHPARLRVLKDHNLNDIISLVKYCGEKNGLAIIDNEKGNISGIVLAEPDYSKRQLHIRAILTDNTVSGVVQQMLKVFNINYPQFTLTAYRRDKYTIYNRTDRLIQLFNKLAT